MSGINEKGLSMVELLVALAISSFLILGVSQIYVDNKKSYSFHQAQLNNLGGARFVQYYLDDLLGKAGYRRAPDQDMDAAFPSAGESHGCAAFRAGTVVTKLASGKGMCLRYQAAFTSEYTCDGLALTLINDSAFTPSDNGEIVIAKLEFKPGESALYCNGQEVVTGISDMRIEFVLGEELEKRALSDSPFVKSTEYDGNSPIIAVRYALLMADGSRLREGESAAFDKWLDRSSDAEKESLKRSDVGKIYQVVNATRSIRNVTP